MSHPYYHALSSARRWGGEPVDYQPIHDWFDSTKAHLPDLRHRALRHHSEGIYLCEQVFGTTIINSSGRPVPVRQVGEQHVLEDLGRIPTAADWLRGLQVQPWMLRRSKTDAETTATGGPTDWALPESEPGRIMEVQSGDGSRTPHLVAGPSLTLHEGMMRPAADDEQEAAG